MSYCHHHIFHDLTTIHLCFSGRHSPCRRLVHSVDHCPFIKDKQMSHRRGRLRAQRNLPITSRRSLHVGADPTPATSRWLSHHLLLRSPKGLILAAASQATLVAFAHPYDALPPSPITPSASGRPERSARAAPGLPFCSVNGRFGSELESTLFFSCACQGEYAGKLAKPLVAFTFVRCDGFGTSSGLRSDRARRREGRMGCGVGDGAWEEELCKAVADVGESLLAPAGNGLCETERRACSARRIVTQLPCGAFL